MRRFLFATLVIVPALALPSIASAQLGGQTSGGTFGSRNLGGSINNPTTGFSGSNQSYSAGVGASNGAQGGSGATGSSLEGAGQVGQGDRFVRGARQPGQFVGGDSQEARAVGQQNSGANGQTATNGLGGGRNGQLGGGMNGQLGGLGGRNGQLGGLNQNGRGGTGQLGGLFGANSDFGGGAASQKPIRPQLVLGFEMPHATRNTRLTTHFESRLQKVPQLRANGPVKVQLEGQTAVLRGQVASEHDRALAARLALLEPGIASVKNELTVVPKATVPVAETIPTPAAAVVPPTPPTPMAP